MSAETAADALARARAVRRRLADGDPPEGWPTIEHGVECLGDRAGEPVPKCWMVLCDQPGVVRLHSSALTGGHRAFNVHSCTGHVEHLARSAGEWVT